MNTLLDPESTEFQILIVPHIYITFTLFSALNLNIVIVLVDLVFLFNMNVTGHHYISLNT